MDEKGFRKFVKEGKRVPKGLKESTVRSHIAMVKEFERFLSKRSPKRKFADTGEADFRAFIRHLAKDDRNTFDNLIGLLRYARFTECRKPELAVLDILNGSHVLPKMCENAKRECGQRKFDEMLGDFKAPPVGTSRKKMPAITNDFLARLESGVGVKRTREILLDSPDAAPPEYYADERKLYKSSKDVDDYLRRRREKFVQELKGHMENGTLFFNQEIDQDVLDFVKRNPEIAGGVRRGDKIYCTKVPYMAIAYLRENNPRMRRYHYCHCPLARESILTNRRMSRSLCYCSAGFEKRPFDVAFGEPVKVQVLKSVLWGDPVCRFALEIPKGHR